MDDDPAAYKELFLSTPSARRATLNAALFKGIRGISIHALREEGDVVTFRKPGENPISIHALREEGDVLSLRQKKASGKFLSTPSARRATVLATKQGDPESISIHALREEGDIQGLGYADPIVIFLSTPSARRATRGLQSILHDLQNFYPRPPRGGRPEAVSEYKEDK